eukprot:2851532-Prymnesium_polylepis.1
MRPHDVAANRTRIDVDSTHGAGLCWAETGSLVVTRKAKRANSLRTTPPPLQDQGPDPSPDDDPSENPRVARRLPFRNFGRGLSSWSHDAILHP